jgi:hypothetical protein
VSENVGGAFVDTIEFVGQRGTVTGGIRQRVPPTLEAPYRSVTVVAGTGDGGGTWTVTRPALPGVTRGYRLGPGGAGYALVWLGGGRTPEVYRTDAGQTDATRVFADPDLVVTDLVVLADGSVWLAAVARPPGGGTIPGGTEVHMLYSESWNVFEKATVEPRVTDDAAMMVESPVTANTVVLTSAPGGTMWAATDTGIILKLGRD